MTEPPILQLSNVGKMYSGGVAAVADFSLTLNNREFVSLVGPSGCGKSTILRITAGLTQPTCGSVARAWDDRPGGQQPLSCVFQEPTLLPWSSVWDNIYLPLRLQSVNRQSAKKRVDEAMRLVRLSESASRYPRQLSGGMKMRASIARALVTNPMLLLLDEPFAALDEITRSRINDDLLAAWRKQQYSALFITHSVFEAVYLSTRVLVMSPRPGRVADEIPIDLPPERTSSVRTSPRYMQLCREVSASLEQSMANSDKGVSFG
jgi:NitT/TauT family transport system ATP-binding protein